MTRRRLTLRWSWRDLRQRWVLVATIALILAIGTGTFASLGSTARWRTTSNDESFAVTRFHDLRVELATGNVVPAGTLHEALGAIPSSSAVTAADERLVWDTQLEVADPDGGTDLVRGLLVGAPVDAGVDLVWVTAGRALEPGDGPAGNVLLDDGFAAARSLDPSGTLLLSGGREVTWVGHALQPEYFTGGSAGEAAGLSALDRGAFGVVFAPLEAAQGLAGEGGMVNDLVLTLAEGTDADAVAGELEAVLARRLPQVGADVTGRDDVSSYRVLYEDAENDQQVWNMISLLVLLGASFAAFNLISRIVESQRREIGIGMALGAGRAELAVRPMLVGVQVALIGVVAGVGVGLLLNQAMRAMFTSMLPLPVWSTPFVPGTYLRAIAIGLVLPFLATLIPVWRAVRVTPVEAIRTGHFATGRSGWARLGTHLRWPRRSTRQYPIRNLLRSPRRSLLTALAIAAAVTVLVGIVGMLDSFVRTIDRADFELTYRGADRLDVRLETPMPVTAEPVRQVAADPTVGTAVPGLALPGSLSTLDGDESFDASVEVLALDEAPWVPRVERGAPPALGAGILVSEKAATDLGVGPGDQVRLEHPRRDGLSYRMVTTTVTVAGTHAIPLRGAVFLDSSQASLFALEGIVNTIQVVPAEGRSADEAQRALFGIPGVASTMPVADLGGMLRDALSAFTGILRIMQVAVLLLALLIAFNSMSISVDERAREHATMFAFGLPVRSVLGMTVFEAAVLGVVGTALGIVFGWLAILWIFTTMLPETVPEIGLTAYLSPATVVTALVAGVVAVTLAPLFTVRKLRRTDVPATLRVVE